MIHIRPYKFFDLLTEDTAQRIVQVKMPRRTECWLLETFLLIAAGKIVNAKRIFEFGTFRGAMTLNLALNFPGSQIFTYDLDPASIPDQDETHAEITRQHFAAERMEFEEVSHSAQVIPLHGDSRKFFWEETDLKTVDLAFVDGGHDMETLKADTINALCMADGCVAWHDYDNPAYPAVKESLDSLDIPIVHVEESRLCFWFRNNDIFHRLSS